MAKITVYNPAAPEAKATGSVNKLERMQESRVGVLENAKQHAELLMTRIVDEMGDRYGVVHAMTGHKPTSGPADPELIEELARSVDWVIVGSAD